MAATLTATLDIDDRQLRVEHTDARRALEVVAGQDLITARARLRYGPGRTCEALARVLDTAIVRAEHAGLDPARLLIAGGAVEPDEDIVRVRRKAHGKADWIHSPTSHVRITLQPAGLHATQPPPAASFRAGNTSIKEPSGGCAVDGDDSRAVAVAEALFEVIDPDLGVNIADLGFVREVRTEDRTAVITMTLTSAACPLTGVMEDQIRAELTELSGIDDFRVDWVWLPPWQPGDITASGRDQLRAIGFTI
jgi:metal-sulfur cluster biosynthetic enzyme/ribosomal protein L22